MADPRPLLSLVELARVAARRGEVDEALLRLDRARAFIPPGVDSPLVLRADALEVRVRAAVDLEIPADLLMRLGSGSRRVIAETQHHVRRRDPQSARRGAWRICSQPTSRDRNSNAASSRRRSRCSTAMRFSSTGSSP